MFKHSFVLFTALMIANSVTFAADFQVPKPLIIELVERYCSLADPNPKESTDLDYRCSDKYEDVDSDEQSMGYSLRLIPLLKQDFNKDGIADLAIEIESSGPLGGSVYTNSTIHYFILDKNQQIVRNHEVLLYAPFSEHIVEYHTADQRIYYSAVPNYRSHTDAYQDGDPIDPPLTFEVKWVDGFPVSTYYQDNCRLANIKNKTLLKHARDVTHAVDIDMHQYTQVITEKVQINALKVTATLEGCNSSNILYRIEPVAGQQLPVLAEVLTTLMPIAHHEAQIKVLLDLDSRSQISFGDRLPLYDNWMAIVHVDRKDKTPHILIIIEQNE